MQRRKILNSGWKTESEMIDWIYGCDKNKKVFNIWAIINKAIKKSDEFKANFGTIKAMMLPHIKELLPENTKSHTFMKGYKFKFKSKKRNQRKAQKCSNHFR